MLFYGDVEVTGTSEILLELLDGRTDLLHTVDHSVGDGRGTVVVVTFFGLSHMKSIEDLFSLLRVLSLLSQSMIEQDIAGLLLDIADAIST